MILELAMAFVLQTQTTTCNTVFGTTTCTTQAPLLPPPPPSRPRAPVPADELRCAGGDWLLAGCTIGAHREAVRIRDARQAATTARERAMALLRQGDCQGAVLAALDTGDLNFATQVRTFCTTP
jgi:hypothetical protein